MKMLSFLKNSQSPSDLVEDTDIDVTPIMNMFIILIPFLVSMAVFTRLAIIEFKVPSNSNKSLSKGTPKMKLTLVVNNEFILFTEGAKLIDSVAVADPFDVSMLEVRLSMIRDSVTIKNEAVLSVNDSVSFENIVTVMDACKFVGFSKLGLSGSAE